eukprot:TRINITY_DN3436_c0_g1_i2.p2 TRINITY_DN3436_c0_g1~~TRINITY_DN3436_c0_g1_i2.p2  ORF type:complete len:193 (-),score=49.28 TRINITY_DN3436_c0_g1_i2:241-819(-)
MAKPATDAPKEEEVHIEDGSDSEEDEATAPHPSDAEADQSGKAGTRQTKGEKKARKAMGKLGLRAVPGITRVTFRKGKSLLFVIAHPDVLKAPTGDTYVVFGEVKVEDLSAQQAARAAEALKAESAAPAAAAAPAPVAAAESADAADADATGLSEDDIQTIMAQSSSTRAQAIAALRAANGDIVNALLNVPN